MSDLSYAQAIGELLKGKMVEVFCGEQAKNLLFNDYEISQRSVIRGKIKDVIGDCLIIECERGGIKNNAYVNGWQIQTIVPINNTLSMVDVFDIEEPRPKNVRK